jgi:signal transduction histidine kinase
VPVGVDTADCEELPQPLQTTAYYLIAEALTNAAKHAGCDRVDVRVVARDGYALVEVRDEGAGGADPDAGSGLRGLADRVSALGGTLEIDSPPGTGTTIRARIGTAAEPLAAVPA